MAWTSPRTWASGEILTDTLMNQQLRDNLLDLNGTASAWSTYTATPGGFTAAPTPTARYKQMGKTVFLIYAAQVATVTAGGLTISLPVNAVAALATANAIVGGAYLDDASTTTKYVGFSFISSATTLATVSSAAWSTTFPITLAANDVLRLYATYEAA